MNRLLNSTPTDTDLFRLAFANSPIGMALVGKNGAWLEVNESICKISGYPREELLRLTFQDITHPDDLKRDTDRLRQLLEGTIEQYEVKKRYIHKQGHTVWVHVSVSIVRDAERLPLFFISQIQDISVEEKLRAEEGKRKQELEGIMANMNSAVVRGNRQYKYLYANEMLAKLLGLPLTEIIGKSVDELAPQANYAELIKTKIDQVFETGKPLSYESTRHVNGADLHLLTHAIPEFGTDGEVETVLGIMTNITHLKQTEDKLRQRESEMRSILEQTQIIIARFDYACRHLYVYHNIEELDKPIEAMLGKTYADVGLSNYWTSFVEATVRQTFAEKKTFEVEIENFITPDQRHFLTRFTPEFDKNGEVETVLCIGFDVTRLKNTENELREALAQVKQLQAILPICSYCRNIRDDQDYWHTVENYIQTHTDSKFSHSVCPNCYESEIKPQLETFRKHKL